MTQKDIARKFGISESAVSLVLNKPNTKAVGAELKRRILAEYRKGAGARLRQKTCIGYLVDFAVGDDKVSYSAYSGYYLQLMDGLKKEAATQGCRLMLIDSLESLLDRPDDHEIDGLVVQAGADKALLAKAMERLPVILLNYLLDKPICDTVAPDNREGLRESVAYLASRGHRRISYMGFRNDLPSTKSYVHAVQRQQGYALGLWEAGLPYLDDLVCVPLMSEIRRHPNGMADIARTSLEAWMRLDEPPTAVVCFNDRTAAFCRDAAEACGVAVPDRLSLVGFDNTPFCDTMQPPLTSVGADLQDMARVAVDLLLMRLNSRYPSIPKTVFCPAVLAERASVRDLAAARPSRRTRASRRRKPAAP